MDRDETLRILQSHKAEIQRYNVKSLAIFGSMARGEAGPDSDVDILVEFSITPSYDLYMDLKFYLEGLLKRTVDLATNDAIKTRLKPLIEKDLLNVS